MNMKKIFCILPLLIILTSAGAQISVSLLRCEQLEDPMGIDVRSPGLSWQIQSAEKMFSKLPTRSLYPLRGKSWKPTRETCGIPGRCLLLNPFM